MTTVNPTVPRFVNVFVRTLLRMPAHSLFSRNTMLLSFTGRKSGKAYTIPVLQPGGRCHHLLHGQRLVAEPRRRRPGVGDRGRAEFRGVAEVVSQPHEAAVESLRDFLLKTPRDAKYHGVAVWLNGDLSVTDLDRAARTGKMIRISLAPR